MATGASNPCLLCGESLRNARSVEVCADCHGKLAIASTTVLGATAEFAAVSDEAAARMLDPAVPPLLQPLPAICTWCDRPAEQVKKLLRGNSACICNECVALCADILQAELGPDWR
jgi:hypothetical protein